MFAFIIIVHLIQSSLAFRYGMQPLTKDFFIHPFPIPRTFSQFSLTNRSVGATISRPVNTGSLNLIRARAVRPYLELYWSEDNTVILNRLEVSSVDQKHVEYHIPTNRISTFDVHPTLDFMFVATQTNVLKLDLTTGEHEVFDTGFINTILTDMTNQEIYFMNCTGPARVTKYSMKHNKFTEEYKLDRCYELLVIDFPTSIVYFSQNQDLFKSTLMSLKDFATAAAGTAAPIAKAQSFPSRLTVLSIAHGILYLGFSSDTRVFQATIPKDVFIPIFDLGEFYYSFATFTGTEQFVPPTTKKSSSMKTFSSSVLHVFIFVVVINI